jgi:hypothetical protein
MVEEDDDGEGGGDGGRRGEFPNHLSSTSSTYEYADESLPENTPPGMRVPISI